MSEQPEDPEPLSQEIYRQVAHTGMWAGVALPVSWAVGATLAHALQLPGAAGGVPAILGAVAGLAWWRRGQVSRLLLESRGLRWIEGQQEVELDFVHLCASVLPDGTVQLCTPSRVIRLDVASRRKARRLVDAVIGAKRAALRGADASVA